MLKLSFKEKWVGLVLKCHPVVELTEIVHGPVAVVVPPVAIVRRHGHAVFPPPAVGLTRQEVFTPLEVRHPRAVVEKVHALRAQVVDAQPDGPVPRVKERLDVVGERLLLPAVAGHRHTAAALQALPGCSGVVFEGVVGKVAFVSYPAALLAT